MMGSPTILAGKVILNFWDFFDSFTPMAWSLGSPTTRGQADSWAALPVHSTAHITAGIAPVIVAAVAPAEAVAEGGAIVGVAVVRIVGIGVVVVDDHPLHHLALAGDGLLDHGVRRPRIL